jgi:hypothetical protein
MNEVLNVPAELHHERDAVIQYAIHGGVAPKELSAIEQWFSNDQEVWRNLHSNESAMHFEPAITTTLGRLYEACDSELRDRLGLDEDAEITDKMRCAFVRDLLSDDWNLNDVIVGISQRWLEDDSGNRCLIGYTEELEGQGIVCYWQGVFADDESWHAYLQANGYTLASDPDDLSDEALLALYDKDD